MSAPGREPLGATVLEDGAVEFRLWAPVASDVGVRLGGGVHRLSPEPGGLFSARIPGAAGADYRYVLDGRTEHADPCSRFQPEGTRGPSRVVDTRFEIAPGPGLALDELVVYELHIGAFTAEGTFDAAIPHLAALAELGVTAIEVMPVATFPGNRNWGYDGVYAWAPHPVYGGPEGLARLVDAAHRAGLGVILDAVYNHIGPGADFARIGAWFTDRHETPWGDALDYRERAVREWAIQNACLWIRDYRIDGLRLDAVFAVFDDGPRHVLAELADRVHALNPAALVISEMEPGNLQPVDEWGHDAQWADELHHELHVLLTGERQGYYAGYGSAAGLAQQLERPRPERLVVCSQNHDQVGNRAFGDRPAGDELVARATVLLLAPETPLLFMGEEYGERSPFQFFTDHDDPFIADATRAGRRREFGLDDLPDPQDPATFERSKLSRREAPGVRSLYRDLLRARRGLPRETHAEGEGDVLRLRRGPAQLTVDFRTRALDVSR